MVADGTDVEEARATKMDEWIVWEAEERVSQWAHIIISFSYLTLC